MTTVKDIIDGLDAKVLCGEDRLSEDIGSAFASDLMSDVLTLDADNLLLITGLANLQVIRTAEMSDVPFILFVRGKKVTDDMLELARLSDMVLMECEYSMFRTCGLLYEMGVSPVY